MKMTEKTRVSYNFKRLREERQWTQPQLASMGKVSPNYIAQIEGMHCDFGVRARMKWAKIFNADIEEFFKPSPEETTNRKTDHVKEKINIMLDMMDEPEKRDVLKYAEEKKLIATLRKKKTA